MGYRWLRGFALRSASAEPPVWARPERFWYGSTPAAVSRDVSSVSAGVVEAATKKRGGFRGKANVGRSATGLAGLPGVAALPGGVGAAAQQRLSME